MTSRLPWLLLQSSERQFEISLARGLPPFPQPLGRANRSNSTPFLVGEPCFRSVFATTARRKRLLELFDHLLAQLRAQALRPSFALCGGSFVNLDIAHPRDLDMVLFYQGNPTDGGAELLQQVQVKLRQQGLDCQLHPSDVDPVLVAQVTAFYASLYLQQPTGQAARAAVMVLLDEEREQDGSETP